MTLRERFVASLPRQLEVKAPALPLKLRQQGEAVKLKSRFIYSYAAYEAARRLIVAKEYAAQYVGVNGRWHLHYRWNAVREKLYVFDEEEMEKFIILVAADLRAWLILRRVKQPVIAIIGLEEEETQEVAARTAHRLGGEVFSEWLVAREMMSAIDGVDMSKLRITAEGREQLITVMKNVRSNTSPTKWDVARKAVITKEYDSVFVMANCFGYNETKQLAKNGAMIVGLIYDGTTSDGENVTGLPHPAYTNMNLKAYTEQDRIDSTDIMVGLMRSAVKMGHVKADIRWD